MFEDLYKIEICIKELGVINKIVIDNEKKDISLNGEYKNILLNNYYDFLESLLRIIREWNSENNRQSNMDNKYIINIKIIEKESKYEVYINKYIPDNIDAFWRLINSVIIKDK